MPACLRAEIPELKDVVSASGEVEPGQPLRVKHLRAMKPGRTYTYSGLTPEQLYSGANTAYKMQWAIGCRFEVRILAAAGRMDVTRHPCRKP